MRSRKQAGMLLAAVLFICSAAFVPVKMAAESAAINCRVESPVDGSIWIGTAGDGLFRLGRNGKSLQYTKEGGYLGSDEVKALVFDNQNKLWILDGGGELRVFTSVTGFKLKANLPEGIVAAAQGKGQNELFLATHDVLYRFDTNVDEITEFARISIAPQTILYSEKYDEIWLFAHDSALKLSYDGTILYWDEAPGISNLLPFKFDTNQAYNEVREGFSFPFWLVILLCILSSLLTLAVLSSKPKTNTKMEQKQLYDVPKTTSVEASKITEPQPTLSKTLDSAKVESKKLTGEFSKKVLSLIKENLFDPSFDVESIAALTGLSRVHVNRKLKAENAPSPSTLIKDARMSMASKLLSQGNLSITQISSECGFKTPSYFATAFKEYYGVSPTEFLENSRG